MYHPRLGSASLLVHLTTNRHHSPDHWNQVCGFQDDNDRRYFDSTQNLKPRTKWTLPFLLNPGSQAWYPTQNRPLDLHICYVPSWHRGFITIPVSTTTTTLPTPTNPRRSFFIKTTVSTSSCDPATNKSLKSSLPCIFYHCTLVSN